MRSFLVLAEVHEDKSCGVPELVCKVTACANLLVRETHIVSGAVARCKSKSECVCAVLIYNNKRINAVAERF